MKATFTFLIGIFLALAPTLSTFAQCPVIDCTADMVLYLDESGCNAIVEYENPSIEDFCFSTTSFFFTGNEEMWIVPEGVQKILVNAFGAQGGNASGDDYLTNTGGKGAHVQAYMDVEPGDTLLIRVGGKGQDAQNGAIALGGWNGGGNGGLDLEFANNGGAGGGGATHLRMDISNVFERVLIAAGGGGAAKDAPGGGGGAPDGVNGVAFGAGGSGIGATLEMGGWAVTTERGATNGYLGSGGDGSTNHAANGGGGGGGGLYGGSGGTSTADHDNGEAGGGGGGSSFYYGMHEPIMLADENSGDGMLTISYSDPNGMQAEKISGPDSGTMLSPGEYEMVFAAFGEFNTTFCEIAVSVLDTVAPQVHTKNITVYLGENEMVFIQPEDVNNGSFDNCEILTFDLSKDTFTENDLGNNLVTLKATDASGNTGSATANVRVRSVLIEQQIDRRSNESASPHAAPTHKNLKTTDPVFESATMQISPNPSQGHVQLNIQLPEFTEDLWLIATSTDGRRAAQWQIPFLNTEDYFEFSVEGWIPGVYIIQLMNANESLTQRLVVR